MSTGVDDVNYSLIRAVDEGRLERARELINSFGLSYSPSWENGYILLRDAVRNNHPAVAKLLLTSGCMVNSENIKPWDTPLHFAAAHGDVEIVKMLLDKRANIEATNNCGRTPLYSAVEKAKTEVTEVLLQHRANVNASDNCGISPLHVAVQRGYLKMVECLLNYGAYVNYVFTYTLRFTKCYTLLHYAVESGSEEVISLLLSRGADVDVKDGDNRTPLHIAAERGHKTGVKLLLQHGAKVGNQDKNGKTALDIAVEEGYSVIVDDVLKYCPDISSNNCLKAAVCKTGRKYQKIVKALLKYGVTVNPEDANNSELLQSAVKEGYLRIVEDLLKYGADVNTLHHLTNNEAGFTPLHTAAKNKQGEAAKLLISYGADINARDKIGNTPIFYAIENDDLKITKLFLTNRANVKDTPKLLHIAVTNRCRLIVEALLHCDADVNASDKSGRTALHFTAPDRRSLGFRTNTKPQININGEIAKLLLSKGSNVDAQTNSGATALFAASANGYADVVEALLEYNANVNLEVKYVATPLQVSANSTMFFKKEAIVDAQRNGGTTALHIATEMGHRNVVEILLKGGADVEYIDNSGRTALHIATEMGHRDVVEILLKSDAKVDSKSKGGDTSLLIAAHKGYLEIVEILLQFGADVDYTDNSGRTALAVAAKEGHARIVTTLLEYGSDINIDIKYNYTPISLAKYGMQLCSATVEYKCQRQYDPEYRCGCDIVVEILEEHIAKMKIASLHVSTKNLKSIESNSTFLQNKCEKELVNMKGEEVSNSTISFHDILTKHLSQLAIYARHENMVQVLKSDDYKTKFPLYAGMIKGRFWQGVRRKELLDQDNVSLFLVNAFPLLPYDCIERILCYISNRDLKMLIDACKPINITNAIC